MQHSLLISCHGKAAHPQNRAQALCGAAPGGEMRRQELMADWPVSHGDHALHP